MEPDSPLPPLCSVASRSTSCSAYSLCTQATVTCHECTRGSEAVAMRQWRCSSMFSFARHAGSPQLSQVYLLPASHERLDTGRVTMCDDGSSAQNTAATREGAVRAPAAEPHAPASRRRISRRLSLPRPQDHVVPSNDRKVPVAMRGVSSEEDFPLCCAVPTPEIARTTGCAD